MSARYEACERRARSRLGPAEFDRALRAGAALTREAAIADALEEATTPGQAPVAVLRRGIDVSSRQPSLRPRPGGR